MNPFKSRKTSYTKIPVELHNTPGLSSHAVRLYVLACSYDPFYFSYAKIKALTGMHDMYISKALKELVSRNMLSYTPGYGFKGGKTRSNVYELIDSKHWTNPKDTPIVSTHTVRADPLIQSESINNTLNNNTYTTHTVRVDDNKASLLDSQARLDRKDKTMNESFLNQLISENDVKLIANESRGRSSSEIARLLKGVLPKNFATVFVLEFMNEYQMTEGLEYVLEALGKMLNKRDSMSIAINAYKTAWLVENEL